MKSRIWLPLVVLLGSAAGVFAQPPGFAPMPGHYGMPGMAPTPMPRQTQMPASQAPLPQPESAPAQPQAAAAMQAQLAQNPMAQASITLKEGIDKMVDFMGQEKSPNKLQVAAFLDREIAPYFDFEYMAKWVAGPTYNRMSPEQKAAMAARLEERFLSALGGQLASYDGQQVRMLRPRMGPRGAVSVNVGILRPGAYPTKMQFRMYRSDDGWKVYDVVANGRSASAYYRTQFRRMNTANQGTER